MKFLQDLFNLINYRERKEHEFTLQDSGKHIDKMPENKTKKLFPTLSVNLEYVKKKYYFQLNSDIKIREFYINIKGKQYSAFLLFIDGMIDSKSINKFVIEPLMLKNSSNTCEKRPDVVNLAIASNMSVRRVKKFNLDDYIMECLVPQNDVEKESKFESIFQKVNAGNSALFVDTLDKAFVIDAKGFEKRTIAPPENEIIIRGSQEGFVEAIRTNTSLIRRLVNNENLIIESASVGSVSKTQIAICYIKNIVNQSLVDEVKYRINNLELDYLLSSRSTRTANRRHKLQLSTDTVYRTPRQDGVPAA